LVKTSKAALEAGLSAERGEALLALMDALISPPAVINDDRAKKSRLSISTSLLSGRSYVLPEIFLRRWSGTLEKPAPAPSRGTLARRRA
jgi:hypothetical protein